MTSSADLAESFAPVARADARVLILGSMPGRASLAAGRYYAYPRNAFWPIMSHLLALPKDADYAHRCEALCDARVALWDVLKSCERPGSLDADIVADTVVANNFAEFYAAHPDIRCVFFNGGLAQTSYRRYVMPVLCPVRRELRQVRLPSTSPAHASRTVEQKIDLWRAVTGELGRPL